MKVQWEDFAKRRRIKLSSFIRSLSYEEYVVWCDKRSVIPLEPSAYTIDEKPKLKEEEPVLEVPVAVPAKSYTKQELNKMKKPELVQLAKDNELKIGRSKTKRELVTLLLNMNK